MKKILSFFILIAFVLSCVMPPQGFAQTLSAVGMMPAPGTQVSLTPVYTPTHLKGMVIDPKDPFKFDFIIYRGDEKLSADEKQVEYPRLIKYFLAALAVPDTDQWVNLSPYEQERIIPDDFGLTEMGRDLLAQDYLLKQIAASLTNPDTDLGKKFWDGVYEQAYQKFGTTDIPTDVINKVWITPDKVMIYEKGAAVYVLENRLKVMLESDYRAMQMDAAGAVTEDNDAVRISKQVMREVIVPAIEKEVNEGKNFAPLRQVYSGMLLATWYKRALKESILGKLYADQGKVKGVDQDPANNQRIYEEYVKAFKVGVFNMIKEDVDRYSQELIPRKYFSGGFKNEITFRNADEAMAVTDYAQNMNKFDMAAAVMQRTDDAQKTMTVSAILSNMAYEPEKYLAMVKGKDAVIVENSLKYAKDIFVQMLAAGALRARIDAATGQDLLSGADGTMGDFRMKYDRYVNKMISVGKANLGEEITMLGFGQVKELIRTLVSASMPSVPVEVSAPVVDGKTLKPAVRLTIFQGRLGEVIRQISGNDRLANQHLAAAVEISMVLYRMRYINAAILKDIAVQEEKLRNEWRSYKERLAVVGEKARLETAEAIEAYVKENIDNAQVDNAGLVGRDVKDLFVEKKGGSLLLSFVRWGLGLAVAGSLMYVALDAGLKELDQPPPGIEIARALSKQPSGIIEIDTVNKKGKVISTTKAWVDGDTAVVMAQPEAKDQAENVGGIDMNAANLSMQIKRDGSGVPLPVSQQDLENIRIDGLVPVLLDIKPATGIPLFS